MTSAGGSAASSRPVFRDLPLIGGHPGLDFLNTVKYRGEDDPQDRLACLADVIEWAQVAGLLTREEAVRLARQAGGVAQPARVLGRICRFREDARSVFQGGDLASPPLREACSRVEMAITALRPVAVIDRATGELSRQIVVETPGHLHPRIVAAVADVLGRRGSLRIKTCAAGDCDWLFIDRTKAGRRCWCDARSCGNLARVRRFRGKR